MNDTIKEGEEARQAAADADLEQEIRKGRTFNPQEALARMAGPGAMKGASPVSPQQQAENEVLSWLSSHVEDPAGALKNVLGRRIRGSQLLLQNVDRPRVALAEICRRLLDSAPLLEELVREVDTEWGRTMDERPYFERAGTPSHPDDPYTLESVRAALNRMLEKLA